MFKFEYWGNETLPANANMALEEFFLKRAALQNVASVRFFSVPKDSIVLGYAQATDVMKKFDNSFDITRRSTGGSHVQIGPNTMAYSFAVPRDGSFRTFEDMRAYFAQHVANALRDLGIESIDIDNRASTINVNEKVVASHAIIWGAESALLHGLIIIDPYDVDRIASRVALQTRKIGNRFYPEYSVLKNIPTVSKLLNDLAPNLSGQCRTNALKEVVASTILKQVTGGKFLSKKICCKDIIEANELQKNKYNRSAWTRHRTPLFTKDNIEKIPGEELNGPLRKNLGYCLFSQVKNRDFKKMA